MWTFRLQEEAKSSISVYFVTFTIAPENCDGNVHKEHLQKFWHDFRQANPSVKFKYYAVSEYGTNTKRPHYHAIIFFKMGVRRDIIHKEIKRWWKLGNIKVDIANDARLHYVTKYHITKPFTPKGKNKTFTHMSRRPFIGSDYVEKKKSIIKATLIGWLHTVTDALLLFHVFTNRNVIVKRK